MASRAPLWRPFALTGGLFVCAMALASSADRPSLAVYGKYVAFTGCYAGGAAAAWGLQRWHGRRWPWAAEVWVSLVVMAVLVTLWALAAKAAGPQAHGRLLPRGRSDAEPGAAAEAARRGAFWSHQGHPGGPVR